MVRVLRPADAFYRQALRHWPIAHFPAQLPANSSLLLAFFTQTTWGKIQRAQGIDHRARILIGVGSELLQFGIIEFVDRVQQSDDRADQIVRSHWVQFR